MPQSRLSSLPREACVAGVDEAGRGPLAGPVVAAAVVLDPAAPIADLDDSKKLTAARRAALCIDIERDALAACVALATVEEVDRLNILRATLLAMQRAVAGLAVAPTMLLIDGIHAPAYGSVPPASAVLLRAGSAAGQDHAGAVPETRCIVGGDASEPAIGAASILAKVHRDRLMAALDDSYPGYDFARHKGYGTAVHMAALNALGPCPEHRRSFAPVRRLLPTEGDRGK